MTVVRFGVSLEDSTLTDLDSYVKEKNFPNRSQAIRHLIEENTIHKKWLSNQMVAGAIVIVYDHHKRDVLAKNNDIQHNYHHIVLSSQHVHLDHDNCLETIVVRGKSNEITEMADQIIALKGVKYGKLVMNRAN